MNISRIALGVSLALNIALGYSQLRLAERNPVTSVHGVVAKPAEVLSDAHAQDLAAAARQVHEKLKSLGLSESETMPIVTRLLERGAMATARSTEYWKKDWTPAGADAEKTEAANAGRIQAILLSIYGPNAESAEDLRRYFRPLDAEYPFLSGAEQQRLLTLRAHEKQERIRSAGMAPRVAFGPPSLTADPADMLQRLDAVLSKQNAFEVALRESPLAQQIRSSGVDLSEAQFRAVFSTLVDAVQHRRPVTLAALRSAVPEGKALQIASTADPTMSALRSAAGELGLADPTLLQVYGVIKQSNDAITALVPTGSQRFDEGTANRLRALMQERHEGVARLVGADAAQRILMAVGAVFRGSAPPQG